MKTKIWLSLVTFASLSTSLAFAEALSPNDFINQVIDKNEGIKSAQLSEKGALERSSEGGLIFSTNFFTNASYVDDKRPTASVASQGNENKAKILELGLSQATRIGLSGKLSYTLSDIEILGTNPAYLARPSYTDSAVKLELNQSLWQNSFGHQWKLAEKASTSSAKASSLGKRYETQMLIFDAETKYWKLAAIRENINILKENLARTQKVLDFNKIKVQRNLTDTTDLLQSEALMKSRTLDLQNAFDEEKDAMRLFNATRNIESDLVAEDLQYPSISDIIKRLETLSISQGTRNDVKAAEEAMNATRAGQGINKDKTRPDLNLFAVGSFNSRENTNTDAMSKSFDSQHPYYAVGVRFTLPLDFSTRGSIQDGYDKEMLGAELNFKKKKFDQDTEWKSLQKKLELIRQRLNLAKEVKEAQWVKLDNERKRQLNGRSTTFQVFSFEQEYLAAQLNLVQIETTALILLAQEKTFHDFN